MVEIFFRIIQLVNPTFRTPRRILVRPFSFQLVGRCAGGEVRCVAAARRSQVAAALTRHPDCVDEERVEDDQRHERNPEHEDDVQPGVIELLEHAALAEMRQIGADNRHVFCGGQRDGGGRRRNDYRAVLKELGKVERDAGSHQRGDNTLRSAGCTELLRLEWVTDHDVAVDGECEGQPHRTHLQCDRCWV